MDRIKFQIEHLTPLEKAAFRVTKTLQAAGFEAYIAGGVVRDLLLKKDPHDIDIATSGRPEEIEKIFPRAYDRGKQFGVMAVRAGKYEFEVATFRTDIGTVDHRRPEKIEFTTAENDAKRRDFTINGLFYDPEKEQIIDYVGGVEDLENRRLRFIGEAQERIDEDYLRMLRAVRFSSRFEFNLDQRSEQAIRANTEKILRVSAERIREELSKMLAQKNRVEAIEMLSELGLLEQILPEAERMKGVEQPSEFHREGDVWTHTMLALKNLPDDASEALAWTVLLHDISKPATQGYRDHPKSKITFFEHDIEGSKAAEKILRRLKFGNDFIEQVSWTISQHMRIINAFREGDQQMSERKQEKLFLSPNIDILLESTRADLSASVRPSGKIDLSMYEEALKKKQYFESRPKEEKDQVKKFTLITGNDIMSELGIESGPEVGRIKKEIEKIFLDGKITTREEAFKMIGKYR